MRALILLIWKKTAILKQVIRYREVKIASAETIEISKVKDTTGN